MQNLELAAEIQEHQSLMKTCEVMVKKFQSEIQNGDCRDEAEGWSNVAAAFTLQAKQKL